MDEFDLDYDVFAQLSEANEEDWLPSEGVKETFDKETEKLLAQF